MTVSSREESDSDGKTREIKTRSFHCLACGAFIRSEDEEAAASE